MIWDMPSILFVVLMVMLFFIVVDRVLLTPKREKKLEKLEGYDKNKTQLNRRILKSQRPYLVAMSYELVWVVLIIFCLRAFLIEPFRIPSGSMFPNLRVGDFILVDKYSYGSRMPIFDFHLREGKPIETGDIVVFRFPPDTQFDYIKRVIAKPGDTVDIYGPFIWVNDAMLDISFKGFNDEFSAQQWEQVSSTNKTFAILTKNHYPQSSQIESILSQKPQLMNSWIVPDGHYFVMGDNRDNSFDSRFWGFVPENHILGQAKYVWMNLTTDGKLLSLNPKDWFVFFKTLDISFRTNRWLD